MSDNFIADVDAKLQELQSQIEELRIARKWYLAMRGSARTDMEPSIKEFHPQEKAQRTEAPSKTVTARVVEFVENYLSDGAWRQKTEIFDAVTQFGIGIGGKDPQTGLSSILSRRDDVFVNDRKKGWSLVRLTQMNESVAAPTATDSEARQQMPLDQSSVQEAPTAGV